MSGYADDVGHRANQRLKTVQEIVMPEVTSAADLIGKEMTPVKYLVEERIPRGLVLLTGRPKMKKSWFALQAMIAVARGGEMLGRRAYAGRSLGLMLEDNDRRMAKRLEFLGGEKLTPEERTRMNFAYAWRRGEMGVAALTQWMTRQPDTTLIVIDVLQKFRGEQDARSSAYALDYAAMTSLQTLARQYADLTILGVHHNRKGGSEIAAEKVSGTFGLTGAVDAFIILDDGPELGTTSAHIDGRDWELWTHDFVWRFDDGGWQHVRTMTDEDELTPAQREWFNLVRAKGRVTPTQAGDERSVSPSAASQMLSQLERRGFLGCEHGTYYALG